MDWPTIIVAAVIAVLFALVIFFHFRNKKKGKSSCSCGGGCSGCAMGDICHSKNKE
ncbi:MAG: FeoB-associated Cys-rich membrane protein [Clostridia bacterium]|nr:FeoB-associated Cys-rich membrane protein [Clostridia bacterium]